MKSWTPQAVLANVTVCAAIDAPPVAFVPPEDPRVESVSATHPVHAAFFSRFTDPFGQCVRPTVLIVESSEVERYRRVETMASIRDILSICVVARARARRIQSKGGGRVRYSRSFDFYPWMVSRDHKLLVTSTPALSAFHDVDCFTGQSAPEVSLAEVSPNDLDRPLFAALLKRWRYAYGGQELSWDDAKLMRSLNMAFHASQPPGDQGVTVFQRDRVPLNAVVNQRIECRCDCGRLHRSEHSAKGPLHQSPGRQAACAPCRACGANPPRSRAPRAR